MKFISFARPSNPWSRISFAVTSASRQCRTKVMSAITHQGSIWQQSISGRPTSYPSRYPGRIETVTRPSRMALRCSQPGETNNATSGLLKVATVSSLYLVVSCIVNPSGKLARFLVRMRSMAKLSSETKILLWGSNIWYLGEGMLGPLFAVFAQRIGGNILDITGAWAGYLAATGILMIYIGRIAGKKIALEKLLLAGYALNALFTFGYLFVSSPSHLLLVQFGLGVAAALAVPPWSALYATSEKR